MGYYSDVARDISKIPDAIQHFETELSAARVETKLKGNVERAAAELPGIVEHRFQQLQEIEAILNYLNIDKERYSNLWTNNFQFFNIISLLNIIIILNYIIMFNSTLYGGWRHTYFLYPFIIILSIYGIEILRKYIKTIFFFIYNINIC